MQILQFCQIIFPKSRFLHRKRMLFSFCIRNDAGRKQRILFQLVIHLLRSHIRCVGTIHKQPGHKCLPVLKADRTIAAPNERRRQYNQNDK